MQPVKVYISGKITGMEKEAAILFDQKESQLKQPGVIPINPMKLPHEHDKSWASYMKECIKALCECDAIYMLSNWNRSQGAVLEMNIALQLGLKITFE